MSHHPDVTLQINLAPGDAALAEQVLPHQLERFAPVVGAVILTVDGMSGGGKFGSSRSQKDQLKQVLQSATERYDNVHVHEVRYDADAVAAVSHRFFDGMSYGLKDRRGGPCHCYLDALLDVETRFIFHIDSDIMFGGDPGPWLNEALAALDDERVIVVNPLGGPPGSADAYQAHKRPVRVPEGHLFPKMSTRIFLADRERFLDALCPLADPPKQRISERLERWIGGHPDQELPEALLSRSMQRAGLMRLDMLGSGNGLWVLHPVHKTQEFIGMLPSILAAIESGDVPADQRGHYDIQPAFAPLSDLPGLRDKIRFWLKRTPSEPKQGRRTRP